MDEKKNNELTPRRTKQPGAETARTNQPTMSEAFEAIRAELSKANQLEANEANEPTENTLRTSEDTSNHVNWTEQRSYDNNLEYEREKQAEYETTTSESDGEVVTQLPNQDIRATKDWQGPNRRRDLSKCANCAITTTIIT